MLNAATISTAKKSFLEHEFIVFSALAFVAKSALLIRLPYREVEINALYTGLILLTFYLYFRFRYKAVPPPAILFFLAAAVWVDVLGNFFDLYNREYWPVRPLRFDDLSHFAGSAFSLPPVMWLLGVTMKRLGYKLPLSLLAFIAVTVTFSFCAYYEILELWDEKFWGDFKRLHTPQDSAKDLQWDLAGIVTAALISAFVLKWRERYAEGEARAEL